MTFRIHKVRMTYQPLEYSEPKDCDSCGKNIPFRMGCHIEADCYELEDCSLCEPGPHSELDYCMVCASTAMIEMGMAVGITGGTLREKWSVEVVRRN